MGYARIGVADISGAGIAVVEVWQGAIDAVRGSVAGFESVAWVVVRARSPSLRWRVVRRAGEGIANIGGAGVAISDE
jgi:hypothetical protein